MPFDHLFKSSSELKRDNWNTKLRSIPPMAKFVAEFAEPVGGWSIFHTATCAPARRCCSPWELANRYRRFMHHEDRRHVSWFLAVEPNPDHTRLNPGYHGHALWADDSKLYGSLTWHARTWWAARHGFNELTQIEKRFVAVVYSSKYLTKGEGHLCVWEAAGALWRATHGGGCCPPGILDLYDSTGTHRPNGGNGHVTPHVAVPPSPAAMSGS